MTTHAEDFGLDADLSNLVLEKVSHSLLGSHYHFRQIFNGITVEKAEIIVSIAYEKGRIYKVYNNTFPVLERTLVPAIILDQDDALDMAWLDLRVHGELITKPKVRLGLPAPQRWFQVGLHHRFKCCRALWILGNHR